MDAAELEAKLRVVVDALERIKARDRTLRYQIEDEMDRLQGDAMGAPMPGVDFLRGLMRSLSADV